MTLEPTVTGSGAAKSEGIGRHWAAQSSSELAARAQRVLMRIGNNFDGPVIVRSQGARLWDADGKEYLDFGSGQLCATVGHNHPHVVAALQRAGASVIHLDTKLVSEDVILLAERLVAMLPSSLDRVTFVNTGSESTELAIKAAKRFTKGFEVVGIARSFHGLTGQAAASTYSYRRNGYGPQPPGHFAIPAPYCYRCPLGQTYPTCQFACIKTGFDLYDAQSVGAPAAFIAEPILSSGGIIEPPAGYFAELKRHCLERGLLLILDEAQTGLGRVGAAFAFEQDGVTPDVLALSKTLGGGLPLGATVVGEQMEAELFDSGFAHITSHINDPLTAAVGLAVLDVIEAEGLVQLAAERGAYFKAGLRRLQERHELIGDVRGRGFLLGLEFVKDRESKEPAEAELLSLFRLCLERGLWVHVSRYKGRYAGWRLAPPLNVTVAELDRALEIIDSALVDVTAKG